MNGVFLYLPYQPVDILNTMETEKASKWSGGHKNSRNARTQDIPWR